MAKNANYVSHKKSKLKNQDGSPQLPSASALVEGEIAINFAENVETLSIKNESGDVVTFSSDNYYSKQKLGSAFTGANSAVTVTDLIDEVNVSNGVEPTNESVEIWVDTSASPITVDVYSKTEVNSLLTTHTGNTAIHLSGSEKENIDSLSGNVSILSAITAADIEKWNNGGDLSNYYTKSETSGATEISNALDDKQDTSGMTAYTTTATTSTLSGTVTAHTANTTIHFTTGDVQTQIADSISSKADTSALTEHTSDTGIHVTTSDKTAWNAKLDSSAIANFFDGAKYELSGTTQVINFYNGDTIKATIDATDFIKDGMIDTVSAGTSGNTTVLVITWNTDAGKSQTILDIGDMFEADNYYQKSETSSKTEIEEAILWEAGSGVNSVVLKNSSGTASGDYSVAEGSETLASGDFSHAEGDSTSATSDSSHAEGGYTLASGDFSHAEGQGTSASSYSSHAEGQLTLASGDFSHAEGEETEASGSHSHAEGYSTVASSDYSHAEGYYTVASGTSSHAEGYGTIANNQSEHASGQYNVSNTAATSSGQTLFSVGNGTADDARHNAFEIRQNGDIYIVSGGTDIKLQDNIGTDLSNYYTKSETSGSSEISTALAGKTDSAATTALNNVVTGHTANTSIHLSSTEKTNIDSLETNIAALSGITSTKVGNWDGAATNSHTHSNKGVLDGISSSDITSWNSKANSATTLGGYGITDAKIENGTITLGGNTITPITSVTTSSTDGSISVNGSNVAVHGLGGAAYKDEGYFAESGHTHDERYYTESELTGSSTTVVVAKAASATTAANANAVEWSNVNNKPSSYTPSTHNHKSDDVTAMTSYSKASSASAIVTGDTLNQAIGKLEKALDGKQASGSYLTGTTEYAGSSTQGGAATSAEKLTNISAIGSGTQPVFFTENGVPSATTYSLSKSVPSNAVFTDTATTLSGHYTITATTADTKSANASSTSELSWGSSVVTGVTLSGDAKGHITAVSVASGKLKTPVTGVTLASGTNNGTVKLTVNGSATDNIAVKGLGTAAYKAEGYFAGSGHSHTNMVTGSSLTANNIILGNGNSAIQDSGKSIETTLSSTLDTAIPTSKAVATYVTSQMTSVLTYKGAISANATLQNAHKVGDVYVVSSAGTYAGKACEVGDYLIANTARESASTVTNADWDAINGENQVENKSASLAAAGSSATLATVDGTNITVTTPSTWTGVAKTGTVTKVSTGAGLVGGDITTTGTLKAALSSETNSTLEATAMGSTANRQYAVGLDKNGVLSVNIPWTNTNSGYVPTGRTITTASGLTGGGNLSANRTIGLEATGTSGTYGPAADVTGNNDTTIKVPQITTDAYGRVTSVTERTYTSVDHTYTVNNGTFAISGNGTSVASTSANASTNSGLNIKNGTFVSLTTGTSELTIGVSTGTSSSTLARGDHNHSGVYQPVGSYLTGISSSDVTTALGYTPYNSSNPNNYTSNVGTVTSVQISLPTGLSASTTAVTSSGKFDIALSNGYSIPTTTKQGQWDTAYTNSHTHGNKSTLDAITASSTAINSLTGSVGTMAFQNTSSYSSATQVNTALEGKSNTGHGHSISEITNLQTTLDGKVNTGVTISAGTGLSGGGDLSTNRTISLAMPTTYSAETYSSSTITSSEPIVYALVRYTGTSPLNNQVCPVANLADGQQCNVIYQSANNNAYDAVISTNYIEPDGQAITLNVPAGGYAEINYINIKGIIFVRGI